MHLRSLRRLRPLIDIYSYLPLKNKPSYVAHPEIILIFAHIINVNYVALIPPVTKGPVINKPFISQKLLSFFNLLRGSLVRIMY